MEIKKKNSKGFIITIVILTVLVVVLGGYIGYDKILNKGTINTTLEGSNNKTTNEDLIKVINFDRKNCINNDFSNDEYIIDRFGISTSIDGLNFSIERDEKNVFVQVRWDEIFPDKYSKEEIEAGTVKYYEDIHLKFDKRVESIFGGLFESDGVQGTVYLFLLEDGSLEYMKYADIYGSQKFEHKPITGVEDIVRFDNIVLNKEKEIGSTYTTIAYKIDGTYYDLSEFIKTH